MIKTTFKNITSPLLPRGAKRLNFTTFFLASYRPLVLFLYGLPALNESDYVTKLFPHSKQHKPSCILVIFFKIYCNIYLKECILVQKVPNPD